MYIEEDLFGWIENRCTKANIGFNSERLEDIVNSCGVWYSLEGIRYETEDFDMTLEEALSEYWWVVIKDKISFVNPDEFAEDLDEYLCL
ncbi:MAG: hypothetical protein IKF82_02370 [Bacilli bacterium]|nr:hypothetical protein [Bacilli bacterium]